MGVYFWYEQADEDFRAVKERFESGRGIAVNALAEYQSAVAMWLRATGRTQ